jgi:cell division FtsZ-interacting protein ZapD
MDEPTKRTGEQIEAELRALWDSQGVSKERQAEVLAQIEEKARPEVIEREIGALFRTDSELTAVGEQIVIPGCGHVPAKSPKGVQLKLWDGGKG